MDAVRTVRRWMEKNEELVRKSRKVLLWRRVSAIPSQGRVSGDFLPKHEDVERPRRIFLFVGFECDSLSERVEEGKKKGPVEKKVEVLKNPTSVVRRLAY